MNFWGFFSAFFIAKPTNFELDFGHNFGLESVGKDRRMAGNLESFKSPQSPTCFVTGIVEYPPGRKRVPRPVKLPSVQELGEEGEGKRRVVSVPAPRLCRFWPK